MPLARERGLLEKLHAKVIQGCLLQLLGNYLEDRSLSVVVNGQSSESLPVAASLLQGSIIGPLLWKIYVDHLLQVLPTITTYADDYTLSYSYPAKKVGELPRPSTSSYE